jgi:hypothetical protein
MDPIRKESHFLVSILGPVLTRSERFPPPPLPKKKKKHAAAQ